MPASLVCAVRRVLCRTGRRDDDDDDDTKCSNVSREAAATAVLILGGEREREEYGAALASRLPYISAQLYVSSGCYRLLRDFDPTNIANPHRGRTTHPLSALLPSRSPACCRTRYIGNTHANSVLAEVRGWTFPSRHGVGGFRFLKAPHHSGS
jgi:hypothetical protein